MSVYDNIDSILKEKRMSRRRLARLAGIKETTLQACFARRPEHFPLKYAMAIAEVLDVDIANLYGTSYRNVPGLVELIESAPADPVIHHVNPKQPSLQPGYLSKEAQQEQMLLEVFDMLNPNGQAELIKRAYEMSQISNYAKKPEEFTE